MTQLGPYQQRVVDEKNELDEKLSKLTAFFDTLAFTKMPERNQDLLRRQSEAMRLYSDILGERIAAFG